ncbi:type 1 fimbrial protein [Salmonella enterica subsp. salamae]|nr:type 1 fimbrial protein [Salmonella enterica subsp. salamae]ECJ2280741.1 type 1 fimbrial protein [Salmonella enterica subsp. salamae]HCC0886638.1 type 1 fimbrial protein [Salmonella enterica]
MKRLPFLSIFLTAAALFFSASASCSRHKATSGVIHFHGEVVEGSCSVAPISDVISVSCFRSGAMRTQNITRTRIASSTLPQEISSVTESDINQHPELHMLIVNYI